MFSAHETMLLYPPNLVSPRAVWPHNGDPIMLFYLQFTLHLDENQRALAWPSERKGAQSLSSDPFYSIGYGSEETAISDMGRWFARFPHIVAAEVVSIPMTGE